MRIFRNILVALMFVASAPAFAESPRIIGNLGQQLRLNAPEGYLRITGNPYFWKLQPVLGLSVASNGSAWLGVGSSVTFRAQDEGAFVRIGSMAGIHQRGSGRDLGGPVQFRTSIDLGVARRDGVEFGIGIDHRSSASIYRPNPGLETAYVFVSMPLR